MERKEQREGRRERGREGKRKGEKRHEGKENGKEKSKEGKNKEERMERKRENRTFTMLLPQFFEWFLEHNFALWQRLHFLPECVKSIVQLSSQFPLSLLCHKVISVMHMLCSP